jgi:hypothetical protein
LSESQERQSGKLKLELYTPGFFDQRCICGLMFLPMIVEIRNPQSEIRHRELFHHPGIAAID